MTPEDRCRQIEKMLHVRKLELRGATPGEQTAAGEALDRLLTTFGAPDHTIARAELDKLQLRLDNAPPGARLTPHPPRPAVQVVFVQGWSSSPWGSASANTSTTTSSGWATTGVW